MLDKTDTAFATTGKIMSIFSEFTGKDVVLLVLGLLGGGLITWLAAKKLIHRPILKFRLYCAATLRKTDFGRKFKMSAGDTDLNNLCVFNLEMHLKGRADISKDQVPEDNKPTLFFPNFTIFDVRTIDYDETRFSIPLAIAANGSMLIVNISRMRSNTIARFQILGTFRDSDTDPNLFSSHFYPGSLHNVDMETAGQIKKPWKRTKDQKQ